MLTIQTWGGWGDILREIALLPVRFGRWKVRHLPASAVAIRPDAAAPAAEEVRSLLERIPGIVWDGEGAVTKAEKVQARLLRRAIEYFHPRLFDPGFRWRTSDEIAETKKRRFIVQTHLQGLPSKQWDRRLWIELLQATAEIFPDHDVEVLDPAGDVFRSAGFVVHDRLTLPQAIRLVESADRLLSIDSWSKYVAAWRGIPQLVIVPDQRSDYPQLTAQAVWKYSFRGVRDAQLVGITTDRKPQYTIGSMKRFQPSDILSALRLLRSRGS
ncbi:MAG: hypothetical protein SFU53_01410 [Terrimicrobiaceae bacterium]|nr:hypothetical protein [Terrimicrobiaceae bacterium]